MVKKVDGEMAKNYKILLLKKQKGELCAYSYPVNKDIYDFYIDLAQKQGNVDFATILDGIQSGEEIFDNDVITVVQKIIEEFNELFANDKQFAPLFSEYKKTESLGKSSKRIKDMSKILNREVIADAINKKKEAVSKVANVIQQVIDKKGNEVEDDTHHNDKYFSIYDTRGPKPSLADRIINREREKRAKRREEETSRDDKHTDETQKNDEEKNDTYQVVNIKNYEPNFVLIDEKDEKDVRYPLTKTEYEIIDNVDENSTIEKHIFGEDYNHKRMSRKNMEDVKNLQKDIYDKIVAGKLTRDDVKKLDVFRITQDDITKAQAYNQSVNEQNKDLEYLSLVDPVTYSKGGKGKNRRIVAGKIGGLFKRHPGIVAGILGFAAFTAIGLLTVDYSGFSVLRDVVGIGAAAGATGIALSWTVGNVSRKKADFTHESRLLFASHREKAVEKLDQITNHIQQMYEKDNVEKYLKTGANKDLKKIHVMLKNKRINLESKNFVTEPKLLNNAGRFGRLLLKPFNIKSAGVSLQVSLNGMGNAQVGMQNDRNGIETAINGMSNKQGRKFRKRNELLNKMNTIVDATNKIMDEMIVSATSTQFIAETSEKLFDTLRELSNKKQLDAVDKVAKERLESIVENNKAEFEKFYNFREDEKRNTYVQMREIFQNRKRVKGADEYYLREMRKLEKDLPAKTVQEVNRHMEDERQNRVLNNKENEREDN